MVTVTALVPRLILIDVAYACACDCAKCITRGFGLMPSCVGRNRERVHYVVLGYSDDNASFVAHEAETMIIRMSCACALAKQRTRLKTRRCIDVVSQVLDLFICSPAVRCIYISIYHLCKRERSSTGAGKLQTNRRWYAVILVSGPGITLAMPHDSCTIV